MKKIQIFAAVFALLAGISVYMFLGTLHGSTQKGYVDVVVAAGQIDSRSVLTAQMLTIQKIPAEAAHADAARSVREVLGMVTQGEIEKGEQVLVGTLMKTGQSNSSGSLAYMIPTGKRAVTVAVDDVSGVAGFLASGDYVDVIAMMDLTKNSAAATSSQAANLPTSFQLFQNILVLAVGSSTSASQNSTYTNVTLALTPQQAVRINLVTNSGKLRLSLRSPIDRSSSTVSSVTQDNILP
ncbi:MAG: Flp pilus assembly protein CpaB [Clostridia bacterium]|nr:Flp pilus assembly protein CpaB [Clostridia bacterium]